MDKQKSGDVYERGGFRRRYVAHRRVRGLSRVVVERLNARKGPLRKTTLELWLPSKWKAWCANATLLPIDGERCQHCGQDRLKLQDGNRYYWVCWNGCSKLVEVPRPIFGSHDKDAVIQPRTVDEFVAIK